MTPRFVAKKKKKKTIAVLGNVDRLVPRMGLYWTKVT